MLIFCESYSVVISRLVSRSCLCDSVSVYNISLYISVCVCVLLFFFCSAQIPRWVLFERADSYIFGIPFGLRHSNGVLTMAVAAVVDCNWVVWFKLPCRTTMVHIPVNVLRHRGISQSSIIGCIIRAGKRE